jgi:hypothetical protein
MAFNLDPKLGCFIEQVLKVLCVELRPEHGIAMHYPYTPLMMYCARRFIVSHFQVSGA